MGAINGRSGGGSGTTLTTATPGETTTTLQNAAVANGNGTALTVTAGDVVRIVTTASGTPNATINYEWSDDGGTTWYDAWSQDLLAASGISTLVKSVGASTTKQQALFTVPPGGNRVRARISMWVAEAITVTAYKRAGLLTLA